MSAAKIGMTTVVMATVDAINKDCLHKRPYHVVDGLSDLCANQSVLEPHSALLDCAFAIGAPFDSNRLPCAKGTAMDLGRNMLEISQDWGIKT